jgi:hypothetical protein
MTKDLGLYQSFHEKPDSDHSKSVTASPTITFTWQLFILGSPSVGTHTGKQFLRIGKRATVTHGPCPVENDDDDDDNNMA